jgi:Fe-S-cluster containining protein
MSNRKFDCCKCGACCLALSHQIVFADLRQDELAPLRKTLGSKFRTLVHLPSIFDRLALTLSGSYVPAGAIKTKELVDAADDSVCACALLEGVPGKKVRCTIYKDRPHVCRTAVTPGDKTCMALRKLRKLRGVRRRV